MNRLPNNLNPERRNFLKLLLISSGAFLLGLLGRSFKPVTKFFSGHSFEVNNASAAPSRLDSAKQAGGSTQADPEPPCSSDVSPLIEGSGPASPVGGPAPPEGHERETDFKNFKVIEKKDSMVFIDKKANEEILILDWSNVDK